MNGSVFLVDLFGGALAVIGFHMAFRQAFVCNAWRRLHANGVPPAKNQSPVSEPAQYGLRISGIMIMIFGIALSMMVTLFHLWSV